MFLRIYQIPISFNKSLSFIGKIIINSLSIHNSCAKVSHIMLFQFASSLASKVRLVKTNIQPVCFTRSRRNYTDKTWNPWLLEYGSVEEYEEFFSKAVYTQTEVRKAKDAGANFDSYDIRRGIRMAQDALLENYIKSRARKITTFQEIAQIGTIAAGGDTDIGEIVAYTKMTFGEEAGFRILDGDGKTPYIEFAGSYNKMKLFSWCLISHYFYATNTVLRNPLILIHEKKISNFDIIKLAIEQATQSCRPLLIVAEDMERVVLGNLMADKTCFRTKVCVIVPWSVEDLRGSMEDIAILTGGQVLGEMFNMNCVHSLPLVLGSCKEVNLKNKITIYSGSGDWEDIRRRREQLRSTMKINTSYVSHEIELRIRELSYSGAVWKVGGASQKEVKIKKDRIDKAETASRNVMKNGVVPGNGVALLYASKGLDNLQTTNHNEKIGIQLLQNALKMPMHMIASKAGVDGSIIIDKLLNQDNPDLGYDLNRGKYTDMIKLGIVEPVPVTAEVLRRVANAVVNYIYYRKSVQEAAT